MEEGPLTFLTDRDPMNRTHRESLFAAAGSLCARAAAAAAALLALTAPSAASMIFNDGGVHDIDSEIVGNVLVQDHPIDGWTEVNVNPGGSITGDARVEDLSELDLRGGSIGRDLFGVDLAWITIFDGEIGRFLRTADDAYTWIYGGNIAGTVGAQGDSIIEVRGGAYGDELVATDNGTLFIFGENFAIDGVPVPEGPLAVYGQLTGTLQFDAPIDNQVNATGDGEIILIVTPIVPEPATGFMLVALAAAGLAVRRS